MADINAQTRYFSGQEVLVDDLSFDQNARQLEDQSRTSDFWTDGVLKDPTGLSNMSLAIDGTTATLINVSQGTAYASGQRISISYNQSYNPNFLSQTTNGVCTQASSGNRGIPLASYTLNQPNYVWAGYVRQISTARTAVSFADGSLHYPYEYDGYGVFVTTVNPPGNPSGITNSVFLGTVYGQGQGNNLVSTAAGLTDAGKVYTQIRPTLPTVTSANIANGAVRGSSANSGGSQREILQGTVSTPDIRTAAVTSTKLDTTNSFSAVEFQGTTDLKTPLLYIDHPSGPNVNFQVGGVTTLNITADSNGIASIRAQGNTIARVQFGTGVAGTITAFFDYDQTLQVTGHINTVTGKLQENGRALIPNGTRMAFYQANVPAGWSDVAIGADFFLRAVNSGTSGGTGVVYTSPSTGFSLQHSHTVNNHTHSVPSDSHTHQSSRNGAIVGGGTITVCSSASSGTGAVIFALQGGAATTGYPIRDGVDSSGGFTGGTSTGNSSPGTDSQLSNATRFSYMDIIVGQK